MTLLVEKANRFYDAALSLLYPQECAACSSSVEKREDGVACEACWSEATIFKAEDSLCYTCGVPVFPVQKDNAETVRCGSCDDLRFAAARSVGLYEGAIRASVLELKIRPRSCARVASLMLAAKEREPLNRATKIMPVPLHPIRLKERGFNQAAVLAYGLGKLTHLEVDEFSLERAAHTDRHRAGMDPRSRHESVAKAFHVACPRLVEGENILLIDDVYTSGATLSSCADALAKAGANETYALTLGRAKAL